MTEMFRMVIYSIGILLVAWIIYRIYIKYNKNNNQSKIDEITVLSNTDIQEIKEVQEVQPSPTIQPVKAVNVTQSTQLSQIPNPDQMTLEQINISQEKSTNQKVLTDQLQKQLPVELPIQVNKESEQQKLFKNIQDPNYTDFTVINYSDPNFSIPSDIIDTNQIVDNLKYEDDYKYIVDSESNFNPSNAYDTYFKF
jgi:hypothetical protein